MIHLGVGSLEWHLRRLACRVLGHRWHHGFALEGGHFGGRLDRGDSCSRCYSWRWTR